MKACFRAVLTLSCVLFLAGTAGAQGSWSSCASDLDQMRIAVNEELSEIETWLDALPAILGAGGRVAVLAYHSLEDRRVKNVFRSWARACVCPPELLICRCGGEPRATALVRGAAKPSEDESAANPRARSARLRMVEWEGRDGR